MESETDPINFIETDSLITSSQEYTLSTTPFARDQPNSFPDSDDVDGINDIWPLSPGEDDATLPDDDHDGAQVIFCSPPPTPEVKRNEDVVSGDSRVYEERNRRREESDAAERVTKGDAVESLIEVLKVVSESKRRRKEEEDGEEEDGAVVDFLETAIRRGYTFPKPRWSVLS